MTKYQKYFLVRGTWWSKFYSIVNKAKLGARLCHQVAAGVPHVFYNFYVVENHKFVKNLMAPDPGEKLTRILRLKKMAYLNLKKNHFYFFKLATNFW